MKVSRSDGNQLTPEEIENNLVTAVTQRKNSNPSGNQKDQDMDYIQIVNYTVPQNGIIRVEFPVMSISSELQLKVRSGFMHSRGAAAIMTLRETLPTNS